MRGLQKVKNRKFFCGMAIAKKGNDRHYHYSKIGQKKREKIFCGMAIVKNGR